MDLLQRMQLIFMSSFKVTEAKVWFPIIKNGEIGRQESERKWE